MWIDNVERAFTSVRERTTPNVYHSPYNALLYSEFPIAEGYTVVPRMCPYEKNESIDLYAEYVVEFKNRPVFILQVKPKDTINMQSSRAKADDQMRSSLVDLAGMCPLSKLRGLLALGTQVCYYEFDKTTSIMTPPRTPSSNDLVVDVAPADRWNYNILGFIGSKTLQEVFNEVKRTPAIRYPL